MSNLSLKALEIAKEYLGVTEHPLGSNKGPEVKKFLNSVGLDEGYSWCAAFLYFCFNDASKKLTVINPLIKTGGVLKHYNETKGVKAAIPQKGDIFIMDFGKGKGHTGLVDEVNLNAKTFTTVEGNSDSSGSRTGGSVCKNTRKMNTVKGFIRY
jgi:hypothetical protein